MIKKRFVDYYTDEIGNLMINHYTSNGSAEAIIKNLYYESSDIIFKAV